MSENQVSGTASGTAKGLVDYLDLLVTRGRTRNGVVMPLKTAVVKILETTEGENWGTIDVTKLDIKDAVDRFKNLTSGAYTPDSYRAYEARMKRALKWYENFLNNPGWFPKENTKTLRSQNGSKTIDRGPQTDDSNNSVRRTNTASPQSPTHQNTETPRIDAIAYPFPLKNGETARIFMPNGVTKSDVQRLSTFLEALVINSEE